MGSIEHLAPGIAREINTPIQYVGDNVRFLLEAFEDLESLMEKHTELLEAVRSGSCDEERIRAVEEAREQTDWEYLSGEVPRAIEQTQEGVDHVCKIVRALTDFFNPSKDERVALDLNQAIESAVIVLRSEWKYVAEVELDFDTYLPCVNCTPGDFNQVILHLLINAVRNLQQKLGEDPVEKGEITIRTRADDRWVEIRFQDTGTGIPRETREALLKPAPTMDLSAEIKGLDLCRMLIEGKYGGSFNFETDTAKGTTFIIRMRHK
jgi:signal transduction histidine kinase